jgi:LacI family transcriptional regulator
VIALVVPDLENIGFTVVTQGVQSAAAEVGYLVVLVDAHAVQDHEGLYDRLVLEERIDGILFAFTSAPDILVGHVAARNVPLILVNKLVEGVGAYVVVDDEWGSRVAVEYLISLGHRRIGFIAGPSGTDTAYRRAKGFRESMTTHGIDTHDRWLAEGGYSEAGGREAAEEILRRSGDDLPTAIYASNLMSALGALRALRAAGLRVPDDLSLIAMDNHPIADHTSPPLTTVEMPLFEMGRQAVALLFRAVHGESVAPVMISDPPKVIERASTAPPRAVGRS